MPFTQGIALWVAAETASLLAETQLADYGTLRAIDSAEALEAALASDAGLVLLDLETATLGAARLAARERWWPPVVVLSPAGAEPDALHLPVNSLVTLPATGAASTVHTLAEYWLKVNVAPEGAQPSPPVTTP